MFEKCLKVIGFGILTCTVYFQLTYLILHEHIHFASVYQDIERILKNEKVNLENKNVGYNDFFFKSMIFVTVVLKNAE